MPCISVHVHVLIIINSSLCISVHARYVFLFMILSILLCISVHAYQVARELRQVDKYQVGAVNSVKMWKTRHAEYSGAATAALLDPGGGENPRSPRPIGAPPARFSLLGGDTPPKPTPEPAYKSGRQGPALVTPFTHVIQTRKTEAPAPPASRWSAVKRVKPSEMPLDENFPSPPPFPPRISSKIVPAASWTFLPPFLRHSGTYLWGFLPDRGFFEREGRGFRASGSPQFPGKRARFLGFSALPHAVSPLCS